jgi:hypothetical protein
MSISSVHGYLEMIPNSPGRLERIARKMLKKMSDKWG